jgi:hypothetical protein
MSTPVIHVTPHDFGTERMWLEHLDPIARQHGIDQPKALHVDQGDPAAHHLIGPDGVILATVRTDRPACPTCGR